MKLAYPEILSKTAVLLVTTALALCLTTPVLAAKPDNNRYIVSFLDAGKGKAALKAAGARILLNLPNQGAAAVHIPSPSLAALRRNPNIEYIEPDVLRYPMGQSSPQTTPVGCMLNSVVDTDYSGDVMTRQMIILADLQLSFHNV